MPKSAVQRDRIVLHFRNPKDIGGSRQKQKVDKLPGVGGLLSKSLQRILAIECVDGRIFFAAQNNIAHNWVNRFGVLLDETARPPRNAQIPMGLRIKVEPSAGKA